MIRLYYCLVAEMAMDADQLPATTSAVLNCKPRARPPFFCRKPQLALADSCKPFFVCQNLLESREAIVIGMNAR
jgi:hypothetical protein